jgi:hypothetical protein
MTIEMIRNLWILHEMGKALGIIGVAAGVILLVIGSLLFFELIDGNYSVLVIPLILFIVGVFLVAYGNHSYFEAIRKEKGRG